MHAYTCECMPTYFTHIYAYIYNQEHLITTYQSPTEPLATSLKTFLTKQTIPDQKAFSPSINFKDLSLAAKKQGGWEWTELATCYLAPDFALQIISDR